MDGCYARTDLDEVLHVGRYLDGIPEIFSCDIPDTHAGEGAARSSLSIS